MHTIIRAILDYLTDIADVMPNRRSIQRFHAALAIVVMALFATGAPAAKRAFEGYIERRTRDLQQEFDEFIANLTPEPATPTTPPANP